MIYHWIVRFACKTDPTSGSDQAYGKNNANSTVIQSIARPWRTKTSHRAGTWVSVQVGPGPGRPAAKAQGRAAAPGLSRDL